MFVTVTRLAQRKVSRDAQMTLTLSRQAQSPKVSNKSQQRETARRLAGAYLLRRGLLRASGLIGFVFLGSVASFNIDFRIRELGKLLISSLFLFERRF